MVAPGCVTRGTLGSVWSHMPDDGDDHPAFDAGLFLGRLDACGQPANISIAADTDRIAVIGGHDDLAVDRARRCKFAQIGLGQKRIIFLRAEKLGDGIITFQELREIRPNIGSVLDDAADIDIVFLRHDLGERRLGGTLDMAVQLGFFQICGHKKLLP